MASPRGLESAFAGCACCRAQELIHRGRLQVSRRGMLPSMPIDCSRISSRSYLGRVMRLPLKIIPGNAVLPILQGPLRGARWVVGSGTHGCWLGTYELPKVELFAGTIQEGMTVFDIGAHAGYYSLIASRAVGGAGHVVAFEPFGTKSHSSQAPRRTQPRLEREGPQLRCHESTGGRTIRPRYRKLHGQTGT